MSADYEAARRVAVGLEKEQETVMGNDLWDISLGEDIGVQAEMPFQFFGRGFEPPDEQTAQRAALMLYDEEFAADRKRAEARLLRLEQVLKAGDAAALSALLAEQPVEEWLNFIFLNGKKLESGLPPLLETADPRCRALFAAALDAALSRLVAFPDLLQTLRGLCRI